MRDSAKRFFVFSAVLGLVLSTAGLATADLVTFRFDPNDLVDLYPAAAGDVNDPATYKDTQPNARRVHEVWNQTAAGTFYNADDPMSQQPQDYDQYVSWVTGLGEGEGISGFNTWLSAEEAARDWGEVLVANTGPLVGAATAVDGWNAAITHNPWGGGYLVEFWTDDPAQYLRPGGADIGEFTMTLDAYVDVDADGFDQDDTGAVVGEDYRIWFGAHNGADQDAIWSVHSGLTQANSGWEGVMSLTAEPIPEPSTIVLCLVCGMTALVARRYRRK